MHRRLAMALPFAAVFSLALPVVRSAPAPSAAKAAKTAKKAVAATAGGAAVLAVVNGPAFEEKFDDPKLTNWTTDGTFSVASGKLTLGNPKNNRENAWLYVKIPTKDPKDTAATVYTDFTVEARARLVSDPRDWGGFGIWFRTNGGGQFRNNDWNPDGGGGYVFNYAPGLGGAILLRRSHSMRIAGPVKPVPIDSRWHTFRVDAIGPHLTAYFDGQKLFDTIHPTLPFGYANGAVGLGVFNRGSVEVDSFKITPH